MAEPLPLAAIEAAAVTIAAVAEKTPVLSSPALDALIDGRVLLKDETHQRAGSFKFRGAYNRLAAIDPADRPAGVVAVSSGNHGAAVAAAANQLTMPAVIHVPDNVASAKRTRIEELGAEIVTFDRSTADREGPARAHARRLGATFVHPFEDPIVMAGQGTAALEVHQQVGPLDSLLVPMSGGGLMAGCGSAMRALDPGCTLVGVEPAAADDTRRSFAAGRPVMIDPPHTIADGLAVRRPGATTFAINVGLVSEVLTVSEHQIIDAMRLLFVELDLVVEPSGAVGVAALLAEPARWARRRVGVIVSGGNIDRARFDSLTD